MSIRISVYDFFSHLIGGSFLLAVLLYILQKLLPIPVNIADLSPSQVLILGTLSYVLGYVSNSMGSIWYRVWVPNDLHQKAVSRLNKELSAMGFYIEKADWYTLIAFIKRNSLEMAQDVEQYNAVSIMLRSASTGFLLFSLVFGVEFLFLNRSAGLVFLCLTSLVLSILLIKEAVKYHSYFFSSIYQSAVALVMKPEQLSVKFQPKCIASQKSSASEK